MSLGLLTQPTSRPNAHSNKPRSNGRFQPSLEHLEDRTVPATLADFGVPLDVSDVRVVDAASLQLEADVSVAGQASETVQIELSTEDLVNDVTDAVTGQILSLELGEINLNLLGLHVDTSPICVEVSAIEGSVVDGLLGDLLGDVTGSFDLGAVLGAEGAELDALLGQIESILDGVLSAPMDVTGVFGNDVSGDALAMAHENGEDFCDILNLSVGPVDLTALGLNVTVNDCNVGTPEEPKEPGPVTVDITAHPEDGVLGQLLCGIANVDLGALDPGAIIDQLDDLIARIGELGTRLAELADRLENLPAVPHLNGVTNQLTNVTSQLGRIADRLDDVSDLEQLSRAIARAGDRVDRLLDRVERIADRFGDDNGNGNGNGKAQKNRGLERAYEVNSDSAKENSAVFSDFEN